MKKENTGVRILTGFLAFILSIVFIISCVSTVMVSAVTSMLKPENIVKLIQNIDFTQLLDGFTEGLDVGGMVEDQVSDMMGAKAIGEVNIEDVENAVGDVVGDISDQVDIPDELPDEIPDELLENVGLPEGVDPDMLNALLKSDAAKEIIKEYTNGMSAVLAGEKVPELTADDIKQIVNDNMDEIVGIAKEYAGEEISEEDLRAQINEFVDSQASELVESLPSFDELQQQMEGEIAAVLKFVSSPVLTYICVGITTLIALLIYACKARRARGLMWLAVDCLLAGGLVSLLKNGFDAIEPMLSESLASTLGSGAGTVVASILPVVVAPIKTGMIVLFVLAAVCLAAFITVRVVMSNIAKKKAEAEMTTAEPALEAADVVNEIPSENASDVPTENAESENIETNV